LPKYKPQVNSSINDYIRKNNLKAPKIEEDYTVFGAAAADLGCAEALKVVTFGVASVLALGATGVAFGAAALYCVSRAAGLAAVLINSG
jgi:hypothetical protein